jgi:FlaA1/EpsC-like NDP-sugar epimerase
MKKQLISLPRLGKQSIVLLVDAFSIALAVWLAYSIRLDRLHFPVGAEFLVYGIPLVIALPIFVKMGLYRAVFRYAGQHALWSIARAVFIYGLIFFAVIVFWSSLGLPKGIATIPRSLGILQPIILLVLIVLSRSLARIRKHNGEP